MVTVKDGYADGALPLSDRAPDTDVLFVFTKEYICTPQGSLNRTRQSYRSSAGVILGSLPQGSEAAPTDRCPKVPQFRAAAI